MSRSGTARLPVGLPGLRAPATWMPVCSVQSDGVRPRVVRVRVSERQQDDPLFQWSLPAGVWWSKPSTTKPFIGDVGAFGRCGVIRYTYGSHGVQRTIMHDLRSGEYQIPPCEYLNVEAARYTPGSAVYPSGFPDMECAAEITDGITPDFTPMLFTAPTPEDNYGSPETIGCCVPPGAYAVEVYSEKGGASRVVLSSPIAIRDYSTGEFSPPYSPLPLSTDVVFVRAGKSQAMPVNLVFFIR